MPRYHSSSSHSSASNPLRRSPRLNRSTPTLPEVEISMHEVQFLARLEGMVKQREAILRVLAERSVEKGKSVEWGGYGDRNAVLDWAKEVDKVEHRLEQVHMVTEKQPFVGELEWRADAETNHLSRSGVVLPMDSPYLSFSIAPSASQDP